MKHGRPLAIAWAPFQPRTAALAADLGGEVAFVHAPLLARHRALLPLRYAADAARTWYALERARPSLVLTITPPVFAPLVVWAWSRLRATPLYVDCHTDAFDSSRWRWARGLHRFLLQRSDAVMLHTDAAVSQLAGWGIAGLLVPDDVPTAEGVVAAPAAPGVTVVIAGSLDGNEPVAEALKAAALLPGYRFRVTGDPARLPDGLRGAAPANVDWTGYLPYPAFLAELRAADAVAVFSTDPGIMNRAAFEAVGLGRPLVLTDFAGLRSRFGEAALFTENEPAAMAGTIESAVTQAGELAARSRRLARVLAAQRRHALDRLLETRPA